MVQKDTFKENAKFKKKRDVFIIFFFFAQPVHTGCVNGLCEALIDLILVIFFFYIFF